MDTNTNRLHLDWEKIIHDWSTSLVERMETEWKNYGNVVSEGFRIQWDQLFYHYGKQIIDFDDEEKRDRLVVLSPVTGSGKSLSCRVAAASLSLLPPEHQPGGRIVVRTTAMATKLVEDINKMTRELGYEGPDFAVAWNSKERKRVKGAQEKRAALADLSKVPIVVTCHRGLEVNLGHLSMTGEEDEVARALENFNGKPRRFFVIDESANFIQIASAAKRDIKKILGYIPDELEVRYASTISWMREIISRDREDGAVYLDAVGFDPENPPNPRGLRNAMRFARLERRDSDNTKRHDEIEETLTTLLSFVNSWTRYYRENAKGTVVSNSRLLLGDGVRGAVVLDATAQANKQMYELYKRTEMIEPIDGLRTYRNVTLRVAKGHNVGKSTMTKSPAQMRVIANELKRNLPVLPEGKTGLLITHQLLEPFVEEILPDQKDSKGKRAWRTTHWGLHDGSNDWSDCDVVVIFGLQLLPQEWGVNVFHGYAGPEPADYTAGQVKEICETLEQQATTVAVIQGASRGSCRRVVGLSEDEEGLSPDMDIYLLRSDEPVGVAVENGLINALPDVKVEPWLYDGERTKRKPPSEKPKTALLLAQHLIDMAPGAISVAELMQAVDPPKPGEKDKRNYSGTLGRFIQKFEENDTNDELIQSVVAAGVTFESGGGRGKPSMFYKW